MRTDTIAQKEVAGGEKVLLTDDQRHSVYGEMPFHRRDAENAETAQRKKKASAFPQRAPRLCGESVSMIALVCLLMAISASAQTASVSPVKWQDCLKQSSEWYSSREATRIADNVLLYQRASGGWPKNTEMAATPDDKERAELIRQKSTIDSTIDNGATHMQMVYLARVFNATGQARFKSAFIRGVDFLLRAQYGNGGWPQFYPLQKGYYSHITFNDDAMIGVMELLRDIAQKGSAYAFIDEARRLRAERAVSRGIDCILKCQIKVEGKLTAWCAQHDERTLAPASARAYEKVSLSGGEGVGITRFLMGIERPSRQVIEAIESAVAWFEKAKLTGIKVIDKPDASLPRGFDRVVVADPQAEPLWARFYEIENNRPIFCGRDGIIKYSLAEIEYERRTGYRWYVSSPAKLLAEDYPAWKKKQATTASDDRPYFLFTSFRKNGEDGLHLALSRDGYRWMALNEDRSYLKPVVGRERLMRDPSVAQGPDGVFRMVWTTGWWDQTIGYASSEDLIHWSEQRAIPVMGHEPGARNAWAPELFYDEVKKQWLIFWATTVPGRFPETDSRDGKNHRIYYVTTRDFETFSPTRLFFDPGFNVIDATVLKTGRKYLMVFKDEREKPVKKNLRLALSARAEGPYRLASEAFTKDWVEGPSGIKIEGEWIVYFDQYREHRYGAVKSRDLKQWKDISSEVSFPADHRHGSVLKISKETALRLIKGSE
jgi:PelA/Pel-15E family pectate lyase